MPVKITVQDGIVIFRYRDNLYLDLETAKETVRIRKSLITNPFVSVGYISNIKGVSKEAREYLAQKESYDGVIAAALICESIVSSVLANFFIRINKPPVPCKVFSSEEKAFLWIKKWVKKSTKP